jgi:decaprenylphospho-beta-D-ribofuranose 2-oxidase
MKPATIELSGWGNYPVEPCAVFNPESQAALHAVIVDNGQTSQIPRGLGRSYGDSAINRGAGVVLQTAFNRMIEFDANSGILHCEAGLSFAEIIDIFLPRGWFLPTTPGTKFVTVGGAIAADVHGKNHHQVGSLGNFTLELRLLLADGSEVTCSPQQMPDLFWATIGGMGLTGVITAARIQLLRVPTAFVSVDYRRTRDLDETLRVFTEEDHKHKYSVAWIDCLAAGSALGRSVVMLADDAQIQQLPAGNREDPLRLLKKIRATVPFNFPRFAIAPWNMRLFNKLYYGVHSNAVKIVDFNSFFYPLDSVKNWNRIYGRRGFVQYQAWFPRETSRRGLVELLQKIAASQRASFLAVLKSCGQRDQAVLSYLEPGHTLALDFAQIGDDLAALFTELDRILLAHGGRLYMAKDSMTTAATFKAMYPRLPEFIETKRKYDPATRFNSSQARRLGIT